MHQHGSCPNHHRDHDHHGDHARPGDHGDHGGHLVPPARPSGGIGSQAAYAWRWFWFIFTKNRFIVAVASLVWLLWRSGSQPRRLGYPCQQAAAANLGFLAVLFVPALARRRRRMYSRRAHIAELATGSIALGGVLFLLVCAGVEVYSDLIATYGPGNPAIISWTSVQPSTGAVLSPALLSPSRDEAVVAVNRNPAVTYGAEPYGPGSNTAYELVWQSVVDLHLGTGSNPLRDLVSDMNGDGVIKVLIKPNTVWRFDNAPNDNEVSYTHPAMIRPIIDMAALAGANQIRVGDGSDGTGAYFTAKMDKMGYTQSYFNQIASQWPNVQISRLDFNNPKRFSWVNLNAQAGGASAYVGSGYTSSNLQKRNDGSAASYFSAKDYQNVSGPGKDNCMGWLAIPNDLFEADLVVDLAKLKVHYLGVNTNVLKNWVGITMYSTYSLNEAGGCRVSHFAYGADNYGNEFGNDILWRELVDAHRAVIYRNVNGTMSTTPQRRLLCITDAINCAEKYHVRLRPWPWWLDTVTASVDPVATDAVASRLQRYDFKRIPIVNNAHAASLTSNYPLGTGDPAKVRVVGNTAISGDAFGHIFAFEDAKDTGLTWPDWAAVTVNDLAAPVINSVNLAPSGSGYQLAADITGCYAAYYYYGDSGGGRPFHVRLARNGNIYTADLQAGADNGVLVAQDDRYNLSRYAVVNTPVIELSTLEFNASGQCWPGVGGSSFTVRNAGVGTLNYTVSVDPAAASWLSVSPVYGSSTGEADTVLVNYSVQGLVPGTYAGTITVSDPTASPTSRNIAVHLALSGYDTDLDGDRDVDQEDFARLQVCLTGSYVPQTDPACASSRLDGDTDVDDDDATLLLNCLSGPGVTANACCVP